MSICGDCGICALEVFDAHPAPYRIVIVDNQGHIVFSKTKFYEGGFT